MKPTVKSVTLLLASVLIIAALVLTIGYRRHILPMPHKEDNGLIRVLAYHDILDHPPTQWGRDPDRLQSDFDLLQNNGFKVISLTRLILALSSGKPLEGKGVVLTFDDATEGQYIYATPLLKRYGYTATFYIPTWNVDAGEPVEKTHGSIMTWAQLRTLAANGFQIASHGYIHKDMSKMSEIELKRDINLSNLSLRLNLGIENRDLCLPYGRYEADQEQYFVESGLRSIALTTTYHGIVNNRLIKIRRFEVHRDTTSNEILRIISGSRKKI